MARLNVNGAIREFELKDDTSLNLAEHARGMAVETPAVWP